MHPSRSTFTVPGAETVAAAHDRGRTATPPSPSASCWSTDRATPRRPRQRSTIVAVDLDTGDCAAVVDGAAVTLLRTGGDVGGRHPRAVSPRRPHPGHPRGRSGRPAPHLDGDRGGARPHRAGDVEPHPGTRRARSSGKPGTWDWRPTSSPTRAMSCNGPTSSAPSPPAWTRSSRPRTCIPDCTSTRSVHHRDPGYRELATDVLAIRPPRRGLGTGRRPRSPVWSTAAIGERQHRRARARRPRRGPERSRRGRTDRPGGHGLRVGRARHPGPRRRDAHPRHRA